MLLSKPSAIVLVLVAAAALGASLSTVVWSHTATRSPSANAAVVVGQAHRIGDLSRGTIRFALDLRLQERKLSAYLRHVQVGGSGLTASEFGARFGPSNADVAALRVLLRRLGITVTHLYPQRTAMLVSSSVSVSRRGDPSGRSGAAVRVVAIARCFTPGRSSIALAAAGE